MGLVLERLWFAARLGPWWIRWESFQVLAVVAGALALRARSRAIAHLGAYAIGIVAALAGALAVGCGAQFAGWLAAGCAGPRPDVEVGGSGALLAFVVAFAFACRRARSPVLPALDAVAPSIAVVLFFARVGCFVGGCDFGAPAGVPWAVRFPVGTPAFRAQADAAWIGAADVLSLPVHPTELYEAAAGLLLFAAALLAYPARRSRGAFAFVVLGYAVVRLAVDGVRGDLARGALGLTMTQGMAVAVLALGAWSLRPARWRRTSGLPGA